MSTLTPEQIKRNQAFVKDLRNQSMKQKLNPNIYIQAAKKILSGKKHCCCWALASVICPKINSLEDVTPEYEKYFEPFEELFNPRDGEAFWWRLPWFSPEFKPKEARVSALLLMAEIAKE